MKKLVYIFSGCLVMFSYAQTDTSKVYKLDEVYLIKDKYAKEKSIGYKVVTLNDSIILNNTESFTSLLRFNSSIFLREYGNGGTSSARFRGTSSSNTAVVWNGININSVNNGMTGFNSLSVDLFDEIDIRSGGGSIKYGSGAIGGTILLNNQLKFGNHTKHQIVASLGSFKTFRNLYKLSIARKKLALGFGMSTNASDNDYKLLGTPYNNVNGGYRNTHSNLNAAYRFSKKSKIRGYTSYYNGERHFSGELPNPLNAKEKYQDIQQRNLLAFDYESSVTTHVVKGAYLYQRYNYFADKDIESFDFGKSEKYILDYNITSKLSSYSTLESFVNYESAYGSTNKINRKYRSQFALSGIYIFEIPKFFRSNIKFRRDFNSAYKVPFTYAIDFEIDLIEELKLRYNQSTNYRVPSYNDLYWPGQGNENLIPETSHQIELGLVYESKYFQFDIGGFYIESKDKIVWTPSGDPNRPGVWVPINVSKTLNKGVELSASAAIPLENHVFKLKANYSFTIAKDLNDCSYLIYVPKHVFNGSLAYTYQRFSMYYQMVFNGQVFTTSDNLNRYSIPFYDVSNIGCAFELMNNGISSISLGAKVNNLYNEIYQTTNFRPMPNRNYNININYKF